ncbi:MAG: hypothetical protein Pars92KO_08340 [Parasphingorhabdus sp.]
MRLPFFSAIAVFIFAIFHQHSAAAKAEPTTEADQNTIVVIGELERKKRINAFIRSAIKISNDEQYARYNVPVCPISLGLKADRNSFIETRIRAVAKAAGAKVAEPECDPNVIVVTTSGSQDFIAYLRKKHSKVFGAMHIPARNRLMKGPGPAYAWNIVRTTSTGGGAPVSGTFDDEEGDGQSFSGSGSRIRQATQQNIDVAILLIEDTALLEINPRQLADYAVMRLLGNAGQPKNQTASESSILSLFSDRPEELEAPQSVTAWDLALLKALYQAPNDLNAQQMRNNMKRIFEKELVKIADQGAGE